MPARFLVPDLDPTRFDAVLPPEEAHHLTKVLRLTVGDDVRVFDGRGIEFAARVASASRSGATVTLLDRIPAPAAPAVAITLVQSILKGDAMDEVVRDCTMAGVRAIQPVISGRTTVKAAALARARERWSRIALAAVKQCGRATLPDVKEVQPFERWLHGAAARAFLLVEPASADGATTLRELATGPAPGAASVVVGPEGGWTVEELSAARAAGCVPLSLGPLTLRADAAGFAAIVALVGIWELRGQA